MVSAQPISKRYIQSIKKALGLHLKAFLLRIRLSKCFTEQLDQSLIQLCHPTSQQQA